MDRFLLPGLFVALTIVAFAVGKLLGRQVRHPIANATLIAVALIMTVLVLAHVSYATYMRGGEVISWLLGPATVALAVPLARHGKTIMGDALPIGIAALLGAAISAILAPVLLLLCGGSAVLALSIAPKAVTTPIAMAIAGRTGGIPALAAVFAITGGLVAAIVIQPLLTWFKVHDHRAFGLAAGVAGSGIGAAQAVERHPQAGAYAAVAIGLNSLITAILLPLLYGLRAAFPGFL